MSGEVLVVTSGKGGVGKTTTTVNLAIALRQQGHSVAVLDADLGMPNVGAFLSLDVDATLHDVLAARESTAEAIVEVDDGLGFVLGERSLEGFADADPARLDDVVKELKAQYQYVLVDTGGGLTYEGIYPMELADEVLLVTSSVPAAITDTKKSKRLADRLGVPVRGVVVTRTDEDDSPESVASELDVDFLGSVPTDDAVVESVAKRQPVVAYAPESAVTLAYYRLAKRLSNPEIADLEPLDTARKPPETEIDGSPSGDRGSKPTEAPTADGHTGEEPAGDGGENGSATEAKPTSKGSETDARSESESESPPRSDVETGSKPSPDAEPGLIGRLLKRLR